DSSVAAVVVHNGSNRAKDSPFFSDAGKLVLVRVTGKTLARVAEASIGHWSQGAAWSPDGKTILVGNMVEKDYWVFSWGGTARKDAGQGVRVNGGRVGIRIADKKPGGWYAGRAADLRRRHSRHRARRADRGAPDGRGARAAVRRRRPRRTRPGQGRHVALP